MCSWLCVCSPPSHCVVFPVALQRRCVSVRVSLAAGRWWTWWNPAGWSFLFSFEQQTAESRGDRMRGNQWHVHFPPLKRTKPEPLFSSLLNWCLVPILEDDGCWRMAVCGRLQVPSEESSRGYYGLVALSDGWSRQKVFLDAFRCRTQSSRCCQIHINTHEYVWFVRSHHLFLL